MICDICSRANNCCKIVSNRCEDFRVISFCFDLTNCCIYDII